MSVKVTILIVYPIDPFGQKVGGIGTFINGFIKYAPEDFDIEFIGITSDKIKRPVKKWQRLTIGKKEFDFLPIFFERDENKKTLIPLSLRFTMALKFCISKIKTADRLIFFNRIEPAILFLKSKNPKIAVIHNDIQKQILRKEGEVLWGRASKLYLVIEKLILNSLDRVYTVSNNTLEFYFTRYADQKSKFSFLPTWVDASLFYPSSISKEDVRKDLIRKNLSILPARQWLLFVGRLQKQKLPFLLIQTFAEYHRKNQGSYLIMIGEGDFKQKIKDYVKELRLDRSVYLLGRKRQVELVEYYRAADVMLVTSSYEGMPMSVLEALGCGLPVVTTDVGEVRRVVKNGYSGEVVTSFEPEDMVQGIERVLNNPGTYTKDNCVSSVKEYTPEIVLKPLYEMVRKLYKDKFCPENQ